MGEQVRDVQRIFRPISKADDVKADSGDVHELFTDGERFRIGELEVEVLQRRHLSDDFCEAEEGRLMVRKSLMLPRSPRPEGARP